MSYQAVIYTHSAHQTRQVIDRLSAATSILVSAGIPAYSILITNVAHDYKLQRWLRDQSDDRRGWPQIYIGDIRVGFFDELEESKITGRLAMLCCQNLTSSLRTAVIPDNPVLEENASKVELVDSDEEKAKIQEAEAAPLQSIENYEVNSWITAAFWYALGYREESSEAGIALENKSSTSLPDLQEKPNENTTDKSIDVPTSLPSSNLDLSTDILEEIKFTRVNWYWAHQERIFRFKVNTFERVEPGSTAVRAVFKYDCVQSITVTSGNYFVIRFNDGSEDQHLMSDSKEKINHVIDLVKNRASADRIDKIQIVNS